MVSRSLVAFLSTAALVCPLSIGLPAGAQSPDASQAAPPSTQSQTAPAGQTPSAPSLQLHNLPADAHTPTPEEAAKIRHEQALEVAMRLATLQAHWGSDMSTPGLSMSLVEVGRTKAADGTTQLSYHLTATGFTPGDSLSLIRWPLDAEAHPVMSGLALDPTGMAICPAPVPVAPTPANAASPPPAAASGPSCATTMKPNDPLVIEATAAPGEPIRVALIDDNRRRGAAAEVIPFPLAKEDQGCRLQILLGMKDASLVLVEGTGFPPNTSLKLESITGSRTRTLSPRTNPDGRLVVADLPEAAGLASGQTTVRFAGVSHVPTLDDSKKAVPDPTCAPSVTFPWGKGAYKAE